MTFKAHVKMHLQDPDPILLGSSSTDSDPGWGPLPRKAQEDGALGHVSKAQIKLAPRQAPNSPRRENYPEPTLCEAFLGVSDARRAAGSSVTRRLTGRLRSRV